MTTVAGPFVQKAAEDGMDAFRVFDEILSVLDAMKMESNITAPVDGPVNAIPVGAGDK